MTMRVTIKNEDAHRAASVTVVNTDGDGNLTQPGLPAIDLGPGQERDFWIHSTRSLAVSEVDEGMRVPPPIAEADAILRVPSQAGGEDVMAPGSGA